MWPDRRDSDGGLVIRAALVVAAICFAVSFVFKSAHAAPSPDVSDAYAKGFADGYRKAREEGRATLVAAASGFPILVASARYGREYGTQTCDATSFVAHHANGRRSASISVNNAMCGDPSPGKRKALDVRYYCGSVAKNTTAYEHRTASLSCD